MKKILVYILVFVLVLGGSFGGMYFLMKSMKGGGHEETAEHKEEHSKEGSEENHDDHGDEAKHEEEHAEKEHSEEKVEEPKAEEPKKEEVSAPKEEIAEAKHEEKHHDEAKEESKVEAKEEEKKPEVAVIEDHPIIAGMVNNSSILAMFDVLDLESARLEEKKQKWIAENIPAEERVKIVGISKGYKYSVDHNRTFLPGLVIELANVTDQTLQDPITIKVSYKRICTNEIWSEEEKTILFGSGKILEPEEKFRRTFFSDKGVESMRHIMPDLEAKIYINGKLIRTLKVGEKEYLG